MYSTIILYNFPPGISKEVRNYCLALVSLQPNAPQQIVSSAALTFFDSFSSREKKIRQNFKKGFLMDLGRFYTITLYSSLYQPVACFLSS